MPVRAIFGCAVMVLLAACASKPVTYVPSADFLIAVEKAMKQYRAATVGIGVIRDAELVWTGYYGEESQGVPAGPNSLFNVASVNKAVTAETALRLASKALIDLDEPISDYYIHPDLKSDARHKLLTPRMLLTHQAGFRNWPYEYDDEKLAFIDEPGNGSYHYSGIGVRIFAKFLEVKLGKPFPQIVREQVFDPIGMSTATNSHDKAMDLNHVVVPVDEQGDFQNSHDFQAGYWSAADDLFVTVPDFAKFLISTMNNDSVSPALAQERTRVQTEMATSNIWGCSADGVDPCPSPYGHGIGWFVFGYKDGIAVHHGGNDRSEAAIGYYRPSTRNGAIIFINSAQGVLMWPPLVDALDPEERFQDVFHDVIAKFFPDAGTSD